jgi:hypothetical protein
MMHDHSVALGAYCDPKMAAAPKTASGAPCSCGGHVTRPTTTSRGAEHDERADREVPGDRDEDQLKALSVACGEKPAEQPAARRPRPQRHRWPPRHPR